MNVLGLIEILPKNNLVYYIAHVFIINEVPFNLYCKRMTTKNTGEYLICHKSKLHYSRQTSQLLSRVTDPTVKSHRFITLVQMFHLTCNHVHDETQKLINTYEISGTFTDKLYGRKSGACRTPGWTIILNFVVRGFTLRSVK